MQNALFGYISLFEWQKGKRAKILNFLYIFFFAFYIFDDIYIRDSSVLYFSHARNKMKKSALLPSTAGKWL